MITTTNLSRRSKHVRRSHADRRRQSRLAPPHERRKNGGRREADGDFPNFPYYGC